MFNFIHSIISKLVKSDQNYDKCQNKINNIKKTKKKVFPEEGLFLMLIFGLVAALFFFIFKLENSSNFIFYALPFGISSFCYFSYYCYLNCYQIFLNIYKLKTKIDCYLLDKKLTALFNEKDFNNIIINNLKKFTNEELLLVDDILYNSKAYQQLQEEAEQKRKIEENNKEIEIALQKKLKKEKLEKEKKKQLKIMNQIIKTYAQIDTN